METDKLIAALVADETSPTRPRLAARVLSGLMISALLLVLFWHVRPDWAQAVARGPALVKQMLPLGLALLAWVLLIRPAPDRRLPLLPFAAVAGLAAIGWGASVLRGGDVMGDSALICLVSIPFLALPVATALLLGLRHRIEPRPAQAGLMAGLFAGAAATVIYALHCNEDAPAFFLLWYGLGITISALAGRAAGKRMLGV
ncbi:DUF1109 domain-containing protein [Salipiger sp. 1_MG-2023]|uniref:DUF1109 domain-containing protein n=1 Tax=Salipiger sp. 1_MG-2023 TaxID=3062665 RepID=UPI0026E29E50|nr:DUF1109 domain-containing protein [Salipiger sp. 1_MG-2023]MDO6586759.1 DUF1109 domain-containing protein [Salipiger sp. 1_MG-2023]